MLNELEYVDGDLFANIYLTRRVVRINLQTDKVVQAFDFSSLLEAANKAEYSLTKSNLRFDECLNGIAFDPLSKRMFFTGKDWPVMFQVEWEDRIFTSIH